MIPALIGQYSIKFSIGIGKSGIEALSMLKNIHIESVDIPAQNELLKNIRNFTKKKILLDLKRKTSFSLMRTLVIMKYISIIGVIGVIGYFIGKLIFRFIDWCKEIEEKYHILDGISSIINEWCNSEGNIFIFIHRNWNKGFNLYEKLVNLLTICGEWLWNAAITCVDKLWTFINDSYDIIMNWFDNDILDDKKGFNANPDEYEDKNIMVRSPYALDKMYNVNDPEVVEAAKSGKTVQDPNDNGGELSDEEIETKKEDEPPPTTDNKLPNSKSALWSAKDKIKTVVSELGCDEVFNETLGKGDEKSIENAEQKIEEENKLAANNNNVTKSKDESLSHLLPKFDSDTLLKDILAINYLTIEVKKAFNNDELMLKQLHTTLESR